MTEFSTAQWDQIRALFEAALERPVGERAAFVSSADDDEAVRAQVQQMLCVQDQAADFLEEPAAFSTGIVPASESDAAVAGRHLGPYQLLREIGRGGMATVYLARHTEDLDGREVALKLVWPGLNGGEVIRRFRQE